MLMDIKEPTSLLLVLPVSHVDIDRVSRLIDRIEKYGDTGNDRVLLVSTWQASWDVAHLANRLSWLFGGKSSYYRLSTENENGWPEAANHLFYETAKHIALNMPGVPWYFMEADCTPLRSGWLAALKSEYVECGKPYMGVVNKSRWLNRNTGKKFIKGTHMVGTGIYPPDFLVRCEAAHSLDVVPWDVAIGAEVVPETHDTGLISHHWGCHKARRQEDGLIYVESIDPDKPHNSGVIPAEAVVAHGVKDGSLDKLLDESEPAVV